jgi:predicted metal-dependent enzyme (double-stranded beta helix superfamily)
VCDFANGSHLPHLHEDEYALDTPLIRSLVAHVKAQTAASGTARDACNALRPAFQGLLAARDWLPQSFQEPVPDSGMGGGIGQWLLYRSADRSLSLFSLVVPPGSRTPIHDHLAWGLIGLYAGNQDEELYAPTATGMELTKQRPLVPGDYYILVPPLDDIHCVRTTSDVTSVSIHLLANDTGCTERHTYDASTGAASPFVSGYANAECAAAAV